MTTEAKDRALLLAERKAFDAGARWAKPEAFFFFSESHRVESITAELDRRYPLPKVSRLRVERDPEGATALDRRGLYWAVIDGGLRFIYESCAGEAAMREWLTSSGGGLYGDGSSAKSFRVTPARVTLWASLLAQPMEEVPGE